MSDDTGPPAELQIPAHVYEKFKDLIELIKRSESMDTKERQYWIDLLPVMKEGQLSELQSILRKEQQELQAIEEKYQSKVNAMGEEELTAIHKEQQERRLERTEKEQSARTQSAEQAEEILKQIDEL